MAQELFKIMFIQGNHAWVIARPVNNGGQHTVPAQPPGRGAALFFSGLCFDLNCI
jgi:hypothetical protein